MKLKDAPLKSVVVIEAKLDEICAGLAELMSRPCPDRRKMTRWIDMLDRERRQLRDLVRQYEQSRREDRSSDGDNGRADAEERRIYRQARQVLQQVKRLPEAARLVQRAAPQPLFPYQPDRHSLEENQAMLMNAAMKRLHRVANPNAQSEAAAALGCFSDIPFPAEAFLAYAHLAYRVALAQKRPRPLRFLDVGCGGGMKVLLAADLFDQAEGFDFDRGYAEAASKLLVQAGATQCRAFEANALTFTDYDQYDVIFFYQPMSNDEALQALELQILRYARPGTILLAPYRWFFHRSEHLDCARIVGDAYVAGASAAEAEALHDEAMRMGPDVLRFDRREVPMSGGFEALWQACVDNGYVP